jgi:ABC-type bacteriocin/lantibiotic exporter with double-glycine peptidase domain
MFLVLLAARITVGYAQLTLNVSVAKQIHAFLSDKVMRRVFSQEPLARISQRTIGYYVSLAGDETSNAGNIFLSVGQLTVSVLSALAGFVVLYSSSPVAFAMTTAFVVVCATHRNTAAEAVGRNARRSSISSTRRVAARRTKSLFPRPAHHSLSLAQTSPPPPAAS